MKLYIHPASPNARKVAMAAAILGIPAETQVVDLMAGDQRKPAYLALNPNGMVPVLQDGDFTLSESNAIMQYLAGKKPGTTLWPADERARARVSQWMCWDLAHWSPTLGIFVWENMFKPLLGRGSTEDRKSTRLNSVTSLSRMPSSA